MRAGFALTYMGLLVGLLAFILLAGCAPTPPPSIQPILVIERVRVIESTNCGEVVDCYYEHAPEVEGPI
jgi:hypothetical protein